MNENYYRFTMSNGRIVVLPGSATIEALIVLGIRIDFCLKTKPKRRKTK